MMLALHTMIQIHVQSVMEIKTELFFNQDVCVHLVGLIMVVMNNVIPAIMLGKLFFMIFNLFY